MSRTDNLLREKRIEMNLSQLQLSFLSGVPANIISNLETGKVFPYAGWKKKLAKALKVSEDEIFQ